MNRIPQKNTSVVDIDAIKRDARAGYSLQFICDRHNLGREAVRKLLREAGQPINASESKRPAPEPTAQKIVLTKVVTTGERGGISYQRISLPRISMQVAAMEERAG